jgi:hypothetical protein
MRATRLVTGAALVLCAAAQDPVDPKWFGLRVGSAANVVDLVELTDGAAVVRVVGSVVLGRGEAVPYDAFRNDGAGFALFAASTGSAAAGGSFVYNVSVADASVISKTPCPAVCNTMHLDFSTGDAITLSVDATLAPGAPGRARVLRFHGNGPSPTVAADVSAALTGTTAPGMSTHCSAFKHFYVAQGLGGAGVDSVLSVDLVAGRVDAVTTLPLAAPFMWAQCDGTNTVGTLALAPAGAPGGNGTATLGSLVLNGGAGAYTPKGVIGIPPGLAPSGLIAGTSVVTSADAAFVASFYPAGTTSATVGAAGVLWAVEPFGSPPYSLDTVSPLPYNLIGAAWDRGA